MEFQIKFQILPVVCLYSKDWIFMSNFFFRFMNKKHLIDVTEIFRQLNGEKKQRLIKLGFYLSLFVIVIYRYASP